jgi:hypothetical protein
MTRRPTARSWCAIGLVLAAALVVPGCVTGPVVPPQDVASPTGGVGIDLWVAKVDARQYEYFRVRPDGGLEYAGGLPAFNREIQWKGALTAEESAAVRAAIDRAGWMTAPSPGRSGAGDRRAEIVLRVPGAERAFEIDGPDDAVDALVRTLSGAASRRFDAFMQRLPEAGAR